MTQKKDIWSKNTPPAKNVDAFIKAAPKESQVKLRELRKIVQSAIPKAEELISYKMPAYKINGTWVVGFAGFKEHIGFYPMSGSFLAAHKKELGEFKSSKGAIQFPLDRKLPATLIKKFIKERVGQIQASKK